MTLLNTERIARFDEILSRGLCKGKGSPNGQMCIEAAITQVLDESFSDEPSCVTEEIRNFKIALNDKNWSSPVTRAKGLRSLGIAQIGSKGVVDGQQFLELLQSKIIKVLIVKLFREVFPNNVKIQTLVNQCEQHPTRQNCLLLRDYTTYATYAAYADAADTYATYAAATYADAATKTKDKYLILCADLALEVLKELKSPGCEWL